MYVTPRRQVEYWYDWQFRGRRVTHYHDQVNSMQWDSVMLDQCQSHGLFKFVQFVFLLLHVFHTAFTDQYAMIHFSICHWKLCQPLICWSQFTILAMVKVMVYLPLHHIITVLYSLSDTQCMCIYGIGSLGNKHGLMPIIWNIAIHKGRGAIQPRTLSLIIPYLFDIFHVFYSSFIAQL